MLELKLNHVSERGPILNGSKLSIYPVSTDTEIIIWLYK